MGSRKDFYTELYERLKSSPSVTVSTYLDGPEAGTKIFGAAEGNVFTEVFTPYPRLVIFGAGHIGEALCSLMSMIGWEVEIWDDRKALLTEERFPGATSLRLKSKDEKFKLSDRPGTYYAVVTRGLAQDIECTKAVLGVSFEYLGIIGSHQKVGILTSNLASLGFSKDALGRINTPIGLRIGAETPQEIGISIAAELIQNFRSGVKSVLDSRVASAMFSATSPAVLATIIEKRGSTPRERGARMLISLDGGQVGTIGGGPVEAAVIRETGILMRTKDFAVREYTLSPESAGELGIVTSGKVKVMLEML